LRQSDEINNVREKGKNQDKENSMKQSSLSNHINRLKINFNLKNKNFNADNLYNTSKTLKTSNNRNPNSLNYVNKTNDINNLNNSNSDFNYSSNNFNFNTFGREAIIRNQNALAIQEHQISGKYTKKTEDIFTNGNYKPNKMIATNNLLLNYTTNKIIHSNQEESINHCGNTIQEYNKIEIQPDKPFNINNKNNIGNNSIQKDFFKSLISTNPHINNNNNIMIGSSFYKYKYLNSEFQKEDYNNDEIKNEFITIENCNYTAPLEDEKHVRNNYLINKNAFMDINHKKYEADFRNSEFKDMQKNNLKEKMKIIYADLHKMRTDNQLNILHSNLNSSVAKNSKINYNYNNDRESNNNNTNKEINKISNYDGSRFSNFSNQNYPNYNLKSINNYNNNINDNSVHNIQIMNQHANNNNYNYSLNNLEKNFNSIFSEFSPKTRFIQSNSTMTNKPSDINNRYFRRIPNKLKNSETMHTLKNLDYLNSFHILNNKTSKNRKSLLINELLISPVSSKKQIKKSFNNDYYSYCNSNNHDPYALNLNNSTKSSIFKEKSLMKMTLDNQNGKNFLKVNNPVTIENSRIMSKVNQNFDLINSIYKTKRRNINSSDNNRNKRTFI